MALPVVEEITYIDPLMAFTPFASQGFAQFLDSAQTDERLGRYSFIVADPIHRVVARDGVICIDDRVAEECPFGLLKHLLSRYPMQMQSGLPTFQGGACGYFGYELCLGLECLNPPAGVEADDMRFPDMVVGIYDVVIAFDHRLCKAWIISTGHDPVLSGDDDAGRRAQARKRIDAFKEKLQPALEGVDLLDKERLQRTAAHMLKWQSNFARKDYEQIVAQCIEHIWAGDIFQANLSQRFSADLPPGFDSYAQYVLLRHHNPAPFAAFQNFGELVIASSSPERFIRIVNGEVETRPIKGTRARSVDAQKDAKLRAALTNSAKDRSENAMIVDLMRNDLSRNCMDGSVCVPEFCTVESYAAVHHLVSSITARLRPDRHALDVLRDSFPGGSITGAPKIRAMQIIAELERHRRGPYCGAMGYVGFNGAMDTNIAIRTLTMRDGVSVNGQKMPGKVCFHAGGGIVADSCPGDEYQETLIKAQAIFDSFEGSPAIQLERDQMDHDDLTQRRGLSA